jgi:hypothetical protein
MEGVQQAEKKAASAEQKPSALFSLGWLHFTTAQRFRSSSESLQPRSEEEGRRFFLQIRKARKLVLPGRHA